MASLVPSELTALQREVLDAFFQRERGFFLIAEGIALPAGVAAAELRAYLDELIRRLLVLAASEARAKD